MLRSVLRRLLPRRQPTAPPAPAQPAEFAVTLRKPSGQTVTMRAQQLEVYMDPRVDEVAQLRPNDPPMARSRGAVAVIVVYDGDAPDRDLLRRLLQLPEAPAPQPVDEQLEALGALWRAFCERTSPDTRDTSHLQVYNDGSGSLHDRRDREVVEWQRLGDAAAAVRGAP